MKQVQFIKRDHPSHWVGDGFPVRSVFSYNDIAAEMSPFLLLDYGGPADFPPTTARKGVGEHPHRGFETVTIVYDGEVEHRDSSGGGGLIGKGDVQWMTAASGVVHQEYHGPNMARDGGRFEMVQLWVNLHAANKMAAPRYQTIRDADIPRVDLGQGGSVRVIAGAFGAAKGPALTFSPMDVLDIALAAGQTVAIDAPRRHTAAVLVLRGSLALPGGEVAQPADLVSFTRDGSGVTLTASADTRLLFLGGEPIEEPIVAYGPFVMNTRDEIRQAMVDYQAGKMGSIAPETIAAA